jgi:ribonuclease H-related protein
MASKKFYGVKVGREKGIYQTWAECQKQVIGFAGALYKSFPTEAEAQEYVNGLSSNMPIASHQGDRQAEEHYDIYVDGSYINKRYGWGFVVYADRKIIHMENGVGEDAEAASIHNVAGELEATVKAVLWAEKEGISPIVIHHDYIGISEWATGKWKTNNRFTQAYAAFIRPYLSWVRFNKVAGHSGIEGNEIADKLAGEALGKK